MSDHEGEEEYSTAVRVSPEEVAAGLPPAYIGRSASLRGTGADIVQVDREASLDLESMYRDGRDLRTRFMEVAGPGFTEIREVQLVNDNSEDDIQSGYARGVNDMLGRQYEFGEHRFVRMTGEHREMPSTRLVPVWDEDTQTTIMMPYTDLVERARWYPDPVKNDNDSKETEKRVEKETDRAKERRGRAMAKRLGLSHYAYISEPTPFDGIDADKVDAEEEAANNDADNTDKVIGLGRLDEMIRVEMAKYEEHQEGIEENATRFLQRMGRILVHQQAVEHFLEENSAYDPEEREGTGYRVSGGSMHSIEDEARGSANSFPEELGHHLPEGSAYNPEVRLMRRYQELLRYRELMEIGDNYILDPRRTEPGDTLHWDAWEDSARVHGLVSDEPAIEWVDDADLPPLEDVEDDDDDDS